jgi:hypothetical protein
MAEVETIECINTKVSLLSEYSHTQISSKLPKAFFVAHPINVNDLFHPNIDEGILQA